MLTVASRAPSPATQSAALCIPPTILRAQPATLCTLQEGIVELVFSRHEPGQPEEPLFSTRALASLLGVIFMLSVCIFGIAVRGDSPEMARRYDMRYDMRCFRRVLWRHSPPCQPMHSVISRACLT